MPRYLHEQENWPQFEWDLAKLAGLLAAVRNKQGKLLGRFESLGFQLSDSINLESLTEEVQKTSEIEGERFEREGIRSSIGRRLGVDVGAIGAPDRNIDGIVEVLLDATENYEKPLTQERLFDWQAALFPTGRSGLAKITVGAWRDDHAGPMQVVSGRPGHYHIHYQAPEANRLEAEMAAFLEWYNAPELLDPVLKAALVHLWFVTIHPFDDGNGRIARAIADMSLARSEQTGKRFYSMSAQIRLEQNEYYTVLEQTQRGSLDTTLWMQWFLQCLNRAFERAETLLEKSLGKAQVWKSLDSTPLNQRQRIVLNLLLENFQGNLTADKWAKITKTSHDTAVRDINDLLAKGVLARSKAGGRSVSYTLAPV